MHSDSREEFISRSSDACIRCKFSQKDAQREEQQVHHKQCTTKQHHILLCILQSFHGKVFLHHILVQSCHSDSNRCTTEQLTPPRFRTGKLHKAPVRVSRKEVDITTIGRNDGLADKVKSHDCCQKHQSSLKCICENNSGNAARGTVDGNEQQYRYRCDHERYAQCIADEHLNDHGNDVQSGRRTDNS